jgi:elongator complex protein 2
MKYESVFISGAVNTVASGLLWIETSEEKSASKCAVYAVHNLLAVIELNSKRIVRTIRGFSGNVTSLASCYHDDGSVDIGAACDDGGVYVCTLRAGESCDAWTSPTRLNGLNASTSALHCISVQGMTLVASGDSKGNVIVWSYDPRVVAVKTLWKAKLPSAQLAKAILLAELPCATDRSTIGLFLGSVDARVHIYCASVAEIVSAITSGGDESPTLFSAAGAVSGHEEWVTCLSALPLADCKSIFLASGSQDSKIRVWNIKAMASTALANAGSAPVPVGSSGAELAAELDVESDAVEGEVIVESNDDETESEARLVFSAGGTQYAVLLESLLVGHEDWVTSVQWMPTARNADGSPLYQLFSTSMDRNMVIWSPDASAGGVWVPQVRMGDIGGALGGSIGGNLLGFVGGCTSHRGDALIGIGYGGSFHLWTKSAAEGNSAGTVSRWAPVPLSSGHFASVNDLCWSDDTRGDYLTTVSADQTCRIFAPLRSSGPTTTPNKEVWKEISRPEIHGYDLNCLAMAPQRGVHTLYTAGEEKLIRVFDAPAGVLRGLEALCGISYDDTESASVPRWVFHPVFSVNRQWVIMFVICFCSIEQAYIPELGLSNKAQEYMSRQEQTEQQARSVARINWTAEPLESQLSDLTLWPGA